MMSEISSSHLLFIQEMKTKDSLSYLVGRTIDVITS
jgi:hypothetical protein